MSKFEDEFVTKFGSTKRIKELTEQFERVKPKEFKKIQKEMERFKLKKTRI